MAISFLQDSTDTANATTYTWSSQSLGTAASDRYIVVALNSRMSGGPTSTSVTVGGVSAILVAEQWFLGCYSSLWIAAVPTGATGDIVATFGAGQVRAFYGAWRLDDLASATASDTDASTAHPHAGTLDIPVDGVGIASVIATDAATMTWSGLTGDASGGGEATSYAFAHQTYPSGSAGQAISATWTTGSKGSPSAVFAAFEFGGGGTTDGVGSSSGVGSASGVGASTAASAASSAGVGAASGVGASTAESVGTSAGVATASAVGEDAASGTTNGVGSSAGVATANAVGASTAAATASASGVGAASAVGVGLQTLEGVGTSAGVATAVGVSGSVLGATEIAGRLVVSRAPRLLVIAANSASMRVRAPGRALHIRRAA
jgi:hypothetical protein